MDVDLDAFFQSLSEVEQEETDWKLHIQFLISKVQLLSQLTKQEAQNPIEFDVFGSSAEDLKCCLPNDIGDMDIMVYPVGKDTTIDDSLIETVDGISPIYVRLRGKNHLVFQHCLVENSDFVAASLLKEFHPNLFGDRTHFLNLIPKIFAKIDYLDPGNMATGVVNKPGKPSCQLDISHSFGSLTEQAKEQAQVFDNFTQNDDFRNLLEWFAVALNPSRAFNEEHSACIDEYLNVAQEKIQMSKGNPSVENYFGTLNQLMSGKELNEIRQKVQDIDERNVGEHSESVGSLSDDTGGNSSTFDSKADCDSKDEIGKTGADGSDSPVNANGADGKETGRVGQTDCDGKTSKEFSEESPPQDEQQTISVQKKITLQLIDGLLGGTASVAASKPEKQVQPTSGSIQSGVDLVPALKARGWPKVAAAWPTRGRAWPSQDIISKVLENGFHMVVKTPLNTDQEDQFFRLSFSRAELILSGELNKMQRECYRCLKIFYRSVLQEREVKIIPSYFLKTILFWAIEKTGLEMWNESNRATCVLMLLERLYKSLDSRHLPHYFVPQYNLLEEAILEHPQEVEYLASEFRKIYENPTAYPNVDDKITEATPAIPEPLPAPQRKTRKETKDTQLLDENASTGNIASSEVASKKVDGSSSNQLFLKYAEFLKIYKEICRELIDLVLQENSPVEADPTLKVIVDNLRAVASKMQNPEAELTTVLNHSTQLMYTSHVVHPGNSTRQRILSALKGESTIFAYIVAQDDLLVEGNEHLIMDRMMNSGAFDVSTLLPNCWDFLKECVGVFDASPAPLSNACEDEDIPLD